MKQTVLFFLYMCVVPLQCVDVAEKIIDSYPTRKDLPMLLDYGMYDQVAKVFNAQCKTQEDVDALAVEYSIDQRLLELILGQSKQSNKPLIKSEKDIIEAAQQNTNFHLAALRGDTAFVKKCLLQPEKRRLISSVTHTGYTVYRLAVLSGNKEVKDLIHRAIIADASRVISTSACDSSDCGYVASGSNIGALAVHKTTFNNKPLVCAVLLILQICVYFF